jgi:hypothetical protein
MVDGLAMEGPTDAQVLDGGWDARFARVLACKVDGHAALIVIDTNGDGAELEAEAWQYGAGGWECGNTSGIGSLGAIGNVSGGRSGCVVWATGLSAPGILMTIAFSGGKEKVLADDCGLWTWVKDDADTGDDELPEITG